MLWTFAVTLGIISLALPTISQIVPVSSEQPTVIAPFDNPWKALSDEEVTGVNILLQDTMHLTGNQGSRLVNTDFDNVARS
jgi:hypothetical protein